MAVIVEKCPLEGNAFPLTEDILKNAAEGSGGDTDVP